MFKRLLIAVAALCAVSGAQVPVTPITSPHITFVDAAGLPCSACTFSTFVAGTTTPLATYTDSTGTSTNRNPIVLDAAGGANIWLANAAYKLVLKSFLGATIWTVDNVKGGGGLGGVCGPAGAIQVANVGVNGLTCDSSITINTTNHTLNVGTLPTNHVTIGALSTPTLWTFDTTSPATALASLGGIPNILNTANTWTQPQVINAGASGTPLTLIGSNAGGTQLLVQNTSAGGATVGIISVGSGGFGGAPAGSNALVINGSVVGYFTTAGLFVPSLMIASGTALTGNQGNGVKVQHSTGATVTGDYVSYDANGNAVDSGIPVGTPTPRTCNSNGCYRISSDGTLEEWGVSSAVTLGADQNVVFVTFPLALTTTTNASLQAWPDNCIDTCGGTTPKNPIAFSGTGDFSTTGATMSFTGVVPTGGGGSIISVTIHAHWHLIQ